METKAADAWVRPVPGFTRTGSINVSGSASTDLAEGIDPWVSIGFVALRERSA